MDARSSVVIDLQDEKIFLFGFDVFGENLRSDIQLE